MPNALVGLVLELRVTAHALEVLHRGCWVASHMRCAHKGGFITVIEHLPERLIAWGARIGVACAATVQKMLARQPHQQQLKFQVAFPVLVNGVTEQLSLQVHRKRLANPR